MDKRFLNKVVDQIVSETEVDHDEGRVYTPFIAFPLLSSHFLPLFLPFPPSYLSSFSRHCKNIYGLNEDEIDYVWKEYKDIIKDKISY